MITEDYCSFETAKLLKEKGFDERCTHYYKNEKYLVDLGYTNIHSYTNSDLVEEFAAPTLQMAMKWLREMYNLYCDIGYDFRLGWNNKIISLKETVIDHDIEMKTYLPYKTVDYPSYEEACESAIKYCLENLI